MKQKELIYLSYVQLLLYTCWSFNTLSNSNFNRGLCGGELFSNGNVRDWCQSIVQRMLKRMQDKADR